MAHTGRLSEERIESRIWSDPLTENERSIIEQVLERGSRGETDKWLNHVLLIHDGLAAEVVSLREALAARDAALRSLEELATKSVHEGWVRAEPVLLTVRAALAGAVVEGAAE